MKKFRTINLISGSVFVTGVCLLLLFFTTVKVHATAPNISIHSPVTGTSSNQTVSFNVQASSLDSDVRFIVPNLNSSLYSWWRMDDFDQSDNPTDYIGNYHFTRNGDASTTPNGRSGNGFVFDGDGDYLSSYETFDAPHGAMTVCAWVNPSTIKNERIFGLSLEKEGTNFDRILFIDDDGKASFYVYSPGGWFARSSTILEQNTWYFLCGSVDTSAGSSIWVNGIQEDTHPLGIDTQEGNSVFIGGGGYLPGVPGYHDFDGIIDEITFFTKTLRSDEILALYNATPINHTETMEYGNHNYKVYASDSDGAVGFSEVHFIIATSSPVENEISNNDIIVSRSSSGSSGSRIRYTCKDTRANNYDYFGAHDQSMCRYTIITTSTVGISDNDLSLGARNHYVNTLQLFLISQNVGPKALALKAHGDTYFFGRLTRDALIEWQRFYGITPSSGYFGPKTRMKIRTMGL